MDDPVFEIDTIVTLPHLMYEAEQLFWITNEYLGLECRLRYGKKWCEENSKDYLSLFIELVHLKGQRGRAVVVAPEMDFEWELSLVKGPLGMPPTLIKRQHGFVALGQENTAWCMGSRSFIDIESLLDPRWGYAPAGRVRIQGKVYEA